ncbi:MAG: hypothetical protein SGI91_14045 [Alphaproteobacteria bacterium]|mgnify:CR=1 FL=1|jgi:hypothetical protein|nr:hypothetical protein [Alphaproteobacteria bacterium]
MRFIWLLAAAVVIAAPAQADPARDALAEVAKCSDIPAAADRLQCYDAAAEGAKTAMSAPVQAPAQRQASAQPAQQEEEGGGVLSWFGLERPVTKTEDFGKPPMPTGPKEINQISATVLEFAKNPYGRSIFILDNGQVWKQIDGDQTDVRDPSKNETMKVAIETGMFGSYSLTIAGRTGMVKVRRVK